MKLFFNYLSLTLGAIIVAMGLELILAPNGLVDGGVTAIAIMFNYQLGWPIWVVYLGLNVPTLLVSGRFMGKKFVIRTLYANAITTLALWWMAPMAAITSSEVLIVLYGGLLLGFGIGLVVKAGGAVDGTEMIAIWVNRRFHVPISTFLLAVNAVILTGAAFIFTLEKAMFSIAVFYIVSKMIDFVLDGLNQGKSVMIISDYPHKVGEKLLKELDVSITYLYGQGGYTGDERLIIYCITNRFMYPKLKDVVLTIDPSAVLEASYVTETSGVKKQTFFSQNENNK
ncbi:YitT family protein [Halalkalibacter akibai]|uniref:Membrane protein n=1 Tax=Halalkalibacter akibai (strain ATCC 43226 / DSM 21942 / CIP 109018 / JCM 9157 / 1139) TaxID=1236973 RepID=W4QPY2_HALA3|nr:YitT family protein [Halalkalibacter akibai]GAE34131.1 membrane protein [Halalkalibacter akibai JCM 9157]